MNDIKVIECKKIKAPKGEALCQSTLDYLEASIRTDGLLNPITLRADPEREGFYEIVAGRHRFHATHKMLKEESIAARVFEFEDDSDARIATIAENICRNQLTGIKRTKLIQEWQEVYRAKYPDAVGRNATLAARKKSRAKPADADADAPGPGSPDSPTPNLGAGDDDAPAPAADPLPFRKQVAETLGMSTGAVGREVRLANRFSADELEVFDQMQVSQQDQLTISDIEDASLRSQVVALVASGMEVVDAIREVVGLGGVEARADPATDAQPVAEDHKPEAACTDDEWYDRYCGNLRDLLAKAGNTNLAKHKSDALLFRHVSEARQGFRKKVKKAVKSTQDSKVIGLFFITVNRLISFAHPKDWFLCDRCTGNGVHEGAECKKCLGGGYILRTEKYL